MSPISFWNWANGEVITEEKLQLITKHCVWTFNDADERDATIPSPFEGMLIYVYTIHKFQYYDGTMWNFLPGGQPGAPATVPADPGIGDIVSALVEAGIINVEEA